MKRHLLCLMLSIVCFVANAQSFSPCGNVLSAEDKMPLAGVTVLADNGSKHYSVTDDKGYFIIKEIPLTTKIIKFVFFGHKTLEIAITNPRKQENLGKLYLQENKQVLESVVIEAQMPMTIIKSDTVQYNASAFKANPDADADNLIAKMPGIVIQDGKIEAQGETITKVYIDGNQFFDSNPLEALASIPADAIESIQIFEELSDEAKESGILDENPTKAINIVTKNKRDKNYIVKAEGSAGVNASKPVSPLYLVGGNTSYFTKENRLTITGIANNVNSAKFGANDDPSDEDLDAYGNVKGVSQGVKTTQGIGINFSRKVDRYELSTSYTYNHVENNIDKLSLRDYYAVEGSYDERYNTTNTLSNTFSTNHALNMRIKYKFDSRNTITFSHRLTYQQYDYNNESLLGIVQDQDSLSLTNTQYDHTSSTITNIGSFIYSHNFVKPRRKASFSTNYNLKNYNYSRTQEQTYKLTDFDTYIEKSQSELTNKLIAQESDYNTLKFRLTYTEPIVKNHTLTLNAQYNRSTSGIDKSNDDYDLETLNYSSPNTEQYSLYNKLNDSYGGGVSYSASTKMFYLNTGFSLLKSDLSYIEERPSESNTFEDFWDFQPYLNFKYKGSKTFYARVYYKGAAILPNLWYMQDMINDDNSQSLSIGNPDLKQGYKHTLSVNINRTNPDKSTSAYFNLWASAIQNYVASSTVVAPEKLTVNGVDYYPEDGALLTQRVNMDGYFSASGDVGYSFTAEAIRCNINISGKYNYVRTPAMYYDTYFSNVHTSTLRVGVVSNISQNVDFNIYSSTSYNITRNTQLSDYSYLNQTIYMASNFIVGQGIVINSEATWRYYQGIGNYTVWNLGLGKKFLERQNAEVRLTVYDLLNQNCNIQRYIKSSYTESVTTNTLNRYVLLKLSYRFNTMSMPKRQKRVENARDISVDELKSLY